MTDPISRYEQLRQEEERIAKEIASLKEDDAFKNDMACKQDIEQSLKDHGKTPQDLLSLFPEILPDTSSPKRTRTKEQSRTRRPLKRYTHPDTGETIESRGLNQKTLRAWSKDHGLEVVKSWGVVIEDGTSSQDSPATK